jgi:hypothetical protein
MNFKKSGNEFSRINNKGCGAASFYSVTKKIPLTVVPIIFDFDNFGLGKLKIFS